MDPKLSGLDPKLREAYERVMNGPASQPNVPTQPEQQQPTAQSNVPPAPIQPNPAPVQTSAPSPVTSAITYNANSASSNQGISAVKRGGSRLSTVFIFLGLIILLVVYTFVWVYVFKLKIPFLPEF